MHPTQFSVREHFAFLRRHCATRSRQLSRSHQRGCGNTYPFTREVSSGQGLSVLCLFAYRCHVRVDVVLSVGGEWKEAEGRCERRRRTTTTTSSKRRRAVGASVGESQVWEWLSTRGKWRCRGAAADAGVLGGLQEVAECVERREIQRTKLDKFNLREREVFSQCCTPSPYLTGAREARKRTVSRFHPAAQGFTVPGPGLYVVVVFEE